MPAEESSNVIPQGSEELCPGFITFRNTDGIRCIILNYRAQTEKSIDLAAFNASQRKSGQLEVKTLAEYWEFESQKMGGTDSPKWRKEMENEFGAANKHLAAYHSFRTAFHCAHYPGYINNATVHIGMDFGTHACAIIAQTDNGNGFEQIHIHECMRGFQVNLGTFIENIKYHIRLKYPNCDVKWYMAQEGVQNSPSGMHDDRGAKSPLEAFYKHGIVPQFKWHNIKDGVEAINKRFEASGPFGKPYVTVNPADKDLVDMFGGGYRRELISSHGKSIPTISFHKDGYHDHASDAARPIFYCLYELPFIKKKAKPNKKRSLKLPI